MSEYIRKEVAVELLKEIKTRVPDDLEACVQVSIDVVTAIPAADVEPVVRCKDCVYKMKSSDGNLSCFILERNTEPTFFCKNGEAAHMERSGSGE